MSKPVYPESLSSWMSRIDAQLDALSRNSQLIHSSIDDGAVNVYAGDSLRAVLGVQQDGSVGAVPVNAPPPAAPTAPAVEGIIGGVLVTWDGTYADGSFTPGDYSRVEVHESVVDGFAFGPATLVSTLESPQGGSVLTAAPDGQPTFVVLVTRNTSGTASAPSGQGSATPLPVSSPDLGPLSIAAGMLQDSAVTQRAVAAQAIATAQLADDAVTAGQLATNAVGPDALAAGSVIAGKIAAGSIQAGSFAAGSVVTGDLAASSVVAAKIAAGAIDASKIVAASITGDRLVARTIVAAQIAAGAITANELAATTILAGNIAAGAITTPLLASGAITADKIAAGAITANSLAADAITGKTISGGTITGATIVGSTLKTAASGARVEIGVSALQNQINFYGDIGLTSAHIFSNPSGDGVNSDLIASGPTRNSMYPWVWLALGKASFGMENGPGIQCNEIETTVYGNLHVTGHMVADKPNAPYAVSLANGWTAFDAARAPKIYKDASGFARFYGVIAGGTLPPAGGNVVIGYVVNTDVVPLGPFNYFAYSLVGTSMCRIDVNVLGNGTAEIRLWQATSNYAVVLNGIAYPFSN